MNFFFFKKKKVVFKTEKNPPNFVVLKHESHSENYGRLGCFTSLGKLVYQLVSIMGVLGDCQVSILRYLDWHCMILSSI